MATEATQEGAAPYTILCPSDITINSSQQQSQTDLINYGTSQNPNSLSKHVQQQISQIFDHPYNAIIRGCKFDIQPIEMKKLEIAGIMSSEKRRAYIRIIISILIVAVSIYVLIAVQPLKNNDIGDGKIEYYLGLIAGIIGIISTLIIIKSAYNSWFLKEETLWNQIREIRLFRFDAANNNIHYLVWTYNYGIYPKLHEPIIKNTQNIIICKIDKLVRITKQINEDKKDKNWIQMHFKNDVNEIETYRYTFKSKHYWDKLKNRASFGSKKPNVTDTYKEIKFCLNMVKPGWQNPGALKYLYQKINNQL